MALVVLCGQPCSGKSTVASLLVKSLTGTGLSIKLIDEPTLNLDRIKSYSGMPAEKNLRGLLRSEVDRSVSKNSIVIVDSLNNIKGYRYELWCIARAAAIQYCLVHCDVEISTCRQWNTSRLEQGLPSYSELIFEDLATRFEEPDKRNRWDSPLFQIKPSQEEVGETCSGILEVAAFLKGINDHFGKKPFLQPTVATQNTRASETNSLYELDQATQEVITALVEAQAQGLGALVRVNAGEGTILINMHRQVGLPELRRHRRTFIKLAGQTSLSGPPPPSDSGSVKRMFAEYLNRELASSG